MLHRFDVLIAQRLNHQLYIGMVVEFVFDPLQHQVMDLIVPHFFGDTQHPFPTVPAPLFRELRVGRQQNLDALCVAAVDRQIKRTVISERKVL